LEDYVPLDDRVKAMVLIHEKCREYIEKQQDQRNARLNEDKKTPEYEPGDWVKLRIHERSNKLSPFWKGPYQILRKVNPLNYEVDFPQHLNQSKIIHVQHIKPWHMPIAEKVTWGEFQEKATKRERKADQTQHRPITRAYAKLLEKADKEKQELESVACIFDENSGQIIEYLWDEPLQRNTVSIPDDSERENEE
jgi:hypothetical protein